MTIQPGYYKTFDGRKARVGTREVVYNPILNMDVVQFSGFIGIDSDANRMKWTDGGMALLTPTPGQASGADLVERWDSASEDRSHRITQELEQLDRDIKKRKKDKQVNLLAQFTAAALTGILAARDRAPATEQSIWDGISKGACNLAEATLEEFTKRASKL